MPKSPIHHHAASGDLPAITQDLADGIPPDLRDPETNHTPLMDAITSPSPSLELVNLLLRHGADANASTPPEPAHLDTLQKLLDEKPDLLASLPDADRIKSLLGDARARIPSSDTVLSLAINAGNLDIITTLLDAGADIHYRRSHGYDALVDAMYGRSITHDRQLIPIIQLLIARGAALNSITEYSESALRVSSNNGRFDAVRVLLDAGADPAPLQWTPLMHAIAFGSLGDVEALLKDRPDLSARDFWSRTPWLLSLQVGDVAKARLLLAAGASRLDRGRCGKTPLAYPVIGGHTQMLQWLLSEGFDPNETDDFQATALMDAAGSGATDCVRILIDAGADIHRLRHSEAAIKMATNLEIVDLLVKRGADLNDISPEMRARLTHLPNDGEINATIEEYRAAKTRRFGNSNPEQMNLPFWRAMIAGGSHAYAARKKFEDLHLQDRPIWCFQRYGKSLTILPDGRIIEIAGEHEDYYDPDFCIYNDVIIHHPEGRFDLLGYPREIFPPTDFHTATHIGNSIYIIGNLGYHGERHFGETPVYRLNLESYAIQKVTTSGENPGWIHGHRAATIGDNQIRITGGKISIPENDSEQLTENASAYILDLSTAEWRKVT